MNAYLFCLLWDITVLVTSMYIGLHESWLALWLLILLKFPSESDGD